MRFIDGDRLNEINRLPEINLASLSCLECYQM